LAHKFNFIPKTLQDFNAEHPQDKSKDDTAIQKSEEHTAVVSGEDKVDGVVGDPNITSTRVQKTQEKQSSVQEKLEKANAINSVLSKRIIKTKGELFDSIEADIRIFLSDKLSELLGTNTNKTSFSDDEVQMLKMLCKQ